MPNVSDLVKDQRAKDRAERRASSRVVTWVAYRLKVGKVTGAGIGIETGEMETYVDPRDGRACQRPKLVFLARSQVAVMPGSVLREGNDVVIDVPSWLAAKCGLKDEWRVR